MSNTASYIGKEPTYGVFITQTETGDGSTTAFTLDYTAATTASLLVSVAGVVQQPSVAFNLNSAGTTLTFTGAPGSAESIWILYLGQTLTTAQATSANVTMITGESAITSLAATDDFLVYDADAAVLKKVQYQYVHSGVDDMAANTVKVRDAASTGAPSDKAVVDTQILIGDGTGFTAAALSSDVTMTNAGAVTIANNAVSLAKMAGLVRGKIIVGDASGDPSALTVGAADQVLTSDSSGDVAWADSVGGASWAIKTAAYTAVTGDGVMVDTDSAAITITLPISSGPPALGDFVRIMDATGNCATTGRNITVARNGNNIQGSAADLTIATNRASIGLVYVNATEGWVLIEN
jgi:hypothetical protein